jgi:SAM-dependent methyltransferase
MAKAFPKSQFVGYDFHAPSVGEANRHAVTHGLGDRVSFKEASAKDIKESGFDLVTCFDCLHDMGDPRGCAAHMRRILKTDGTWMIVEPIAGNRPEDNMNPVGRLYYNASTMICVPTSLDQEVGEGLGAQAGEIKLTEVIHDGGFTQVRRALPDRSTWSLRLGPSRALVSRYQEQCWALSGVGPSRHLLAQAQTRSLSARSGHGRASTHPTRGPEIFYRE